MNLDAIREKITMSNSVNNYKELCELFDLPVKSGSSKVAQMKEVKRYINLEKVGHSFKIIEIYDSVLPKDNEREIYKNHIQLIILNYLAENGSVLLTKSKIMLLCGLCNEKYFMIKQKEYMESSMLDYNVNSHNVNSLKDRFTNKSNFTFNLRDFYRRTSLKFSQIIDSAILGLGRKNCCYGVVHKVYQIHKDGETFIGSLEDEHNISEVKRVILDKMKLDGVVQVFRQFKNKEFFDRVNELLNQLYGWDMCYNVYQIIPNSRINDNLHQFTKQLNEINQERKLLNSKIIEFFNCDAEYLYNKNMEKVNFIKNEKCEFVLPESYLDIQKIISEYLLEI